MISAESNLHAAEDVLLKVGVIFHRTENRTNVGTAIQERIQCQLMELRFLAFIRAFLRLWPDQTASTLD
jgi:hypothetical protein